MNTIQEQIKAYLSDGKFSGGRKNAGWSPKHLEKKTLHLVFWVKTLKLKKIFDLTHIEFRAKLTQMAEKGKTNKTISNYAEAMTSFLKWCVEMDVIDERENPLRKFRTWSQKVTTKTGYFTRKEFDRMMKHSGDLFKLTCQVAVCTGYRRGELGELTARSLKEYEGTYWLCLDGQFCKNGKDAMQPLPGELAEILLEEVKDLKPDDPLLWVPYHTSKSMNMLMEDAGVHKYSNPTTKRTFHSLRDSYITWMAQSGVDIRTIQMLARHSDIRITERYLHTCDERKLLAIRKLDIFQEYKPRALTGKKAISA